MKKQSAACRSEAEARFESARAGLAARIAARTLGVEKVETVNTSLTLYRHDAALNAHAARPQSCALTETI